jgi:chromosome segregation ATPase
VVNERDTLQTRADTDALAATQLRRELAAVVNERDSLKPQLGQQTEAGADTLASAQLRQELAAVALERDTLQAQAEADTLARAQLRRDLAAVVNERDTLQAQAEGDALAVAQLRRELAAVALERDSLKSQLGEQTKAEADASARLHSQLEAKDTECKRLASVQLEHRETIDRQGTELATAAAAVRAEVDTAKTAANAFASTIRTLEARCQGKQDKLDALEAQLHALQSSATDSSSGRDDGAYDSGDASIPSLLSSSAGTASAPQAPNAGMQPGVRVFRMQAHGVRRDLSLGSTQPSR